MQNSQKSEQQIQTEIIKWLRSRGYYVVKTILAGRSGVPDILTCIQGKFYAFEVKQGHKKATKLQDYNIQLIEKAGGAAWVVTSLDDVKKAINNYF